jgi:hypothetical protein
MFIVAIGLTFALAAFALEKMRKHTLDEKQIASGELAEEARSPRPALSRMQAATTLPLAGRIQQQLHVSGIATVDI